MLNQKTSRALLLAAAAAAFFSAANADDATSSYTAWICDAYTKPDVSLKEIAHTHTYIYICGQRLDWRSIVTTAEKQ